MRGARIAGVLLLCLLLGAAGAGASRKKKAPAKKAPQAVTVASVEPDSTVTVSEESMAYAACGDDNEIIEAIVDPAFGDLEKGCNASDSYSIVAASCIGEHECLVRASTDIFEDACPFQPGKTLQFGIICAGGGSSTLPVTSPPPSPPRSPAPSPPPRPPPPRPRPPPRLLSPPPSPRPPTAVAVPRPSPSPPPPAPTSAPANSQTSLLWGQSGELYRAGGRLGDWSQAGYGAAERPIPNYPVRFNVRNAPYSARGDGTTDDSAAIQRALDDAAREAARTNSGVAVFMPDGTYMIRTRLLIKSSYVVLRGSSKERCNLYFPVPLQAVYGSSATWAFSGSWLSIAGRRMDSKDVKNKLTDVTAPANRGDYRLRVATTAGISVGQWVRLWQPASDNTNRRRRLQAGTQEAGLLQPGRKLVQQGREAPPMPQVFEDPALQIALEAAVAADWAIGRALERDPDRVPSQSLLPNGTNPLSLDPMLYAAVYYAALASESELEPGRVPATAAMGSLESYLYGNNVVDSGNPTNMFYGKERVRFVSRVAVVGPDWVQFERALPYDVELKWKPVLHRFNPALVESGFENFQMTFKWSTYADHLDVKGNNGIGIYDAAHCWVSNIRLTDADNGVMVNGADFVTVDRVDTQFTKKRGVGAMAKREGGFGCNGHHAIWTSSCSNVLVSNFDIPWRWYHDLSVDSFAEHTVYSSGKGVDINIDCHRAGTHNNLFTNIDAGTGRRMFASGGAKDRGAYSGANSTWWNVYATARTPAKLPDCQFGPMLNMFGYWTVPAGKRRLLAAADEEAPKAALAGQAHKPMRVKAQSSGSTTTSGSSSSSDALVPAQSTAWCTREGWWVEQVPSGRSIWPPDLYSAQVMARRGGRLR